MNTYTLWGFHPAYKGRDGKPYLIHLDKQRKKTMCDCPNLNHTYGCPAYKGTPSNLEVFYTDTPWELQDAEDALVPLEQGESFNHLGVACFIVLAAFGGILWFML